MSILDHVESFITKKLACMKTKCFVFLESFAFQCISSSFSWDYLNLIYINACCKLLLENDRIGI